MAQKRSKSPTSETAARPAPSALSAETIAAGTTAGALMLGVVQADAARKDAALQTIAPASDNEMASDSRDGARVENASVVGPAGSEPGKPSGQAVPTDVAPAQSIETAGMRAGTPANDAGAGDPAAGGIANGSDKAPAPSGDTLRIEEPGHDAASMGANISDAALPADAEAIVTRISDQITSAIDRIAVNLQDGGLTGDLGQAIAADIAETALAIVRDIPVLSPSSLPTDVTGVLPDAGEINDQIQTLLGGLEPASDLATLPADLLGAEAVSDLSGGLLSDLFYSDGAGEAPATLTSMSAAPAATIVDAGLSDAASSMVDGFSPMSIELIGMSYSDATDLPYSGMQSSLGAMHLV